MPVPLHMGAPGKPLLRVSVSWVCVCDLALLYGYLCWSESDLSCFLSLAPWLGTRAGQVTGKTLRGPCSIHVSCFVSALLGVVPLVGRSLTSWYQGPPKRLSRGAGQPMGPSTPPCSSQSCAVFVSFSCLNQPFLSRIKACCFG